MKDPKDLATADLLTKRGPGRPRIANPLSGAERQRRFRERRRKEGGTSVLLSGDDLATIVVALRADLETSDPCSAWYADVRRVLDRLGAEVPQ